MAIPDTHQDDDGQSRSKEPPPLSINRLAVLHSRERLLVHPLLWTDRQLALLGCRIHLRGEAGDAGGVEDHPAPRKRAGRSLVPLLTRRLKFRLENWEFEDTVWKLIKSVSKNTSMENNRVVGFHFAQRSRATIPYCRMAVKNVTFACFDMYQAFEQRHLYFRPPENRLLNMDLPGLNRSCILENRYTPAQDEKDPYLVALVIALAQRKRRRAPQRQAAPSAFTVRILFVGEEPPVPFNLFVAHVQASFLDKLDFPAQDPPVGSGLDIYHWRISAEPFETLARRLVWCLKHDCCGESHDTRNTSDPKKESGQKRKLDVDSDTSAPLPKR